MGTSEREIKRIDIKEFREFGFLQEINRRFLHPIGMALEVLIDEETGEEMLGGIWDYREDPDGMSYYDLSSEESLEKHKRVREFMRKKHLERKEILGFIIQPIGHTYKDKEDERD